jgi:hypothetical protein
MVSPLQGEKGFFPLPRVCNPGLEEFKPFRLAGEKDHSSKERRYISHRKTGIFHDPEIDYLSDVGVTI